PTWVDNPASAPDPGRGTTDFDVFLIDQEGRSDIPEFLDRWARETGGTRPTLTIGSRSLAGHDRPTAPAATVSLVRPVLPRELRKALGHLVCRVEVADPTPPRQPECDLPSLRILVAEDNPINQNLLTTLLEREGHRCQVVSDGRAVLTALEDGS